MLEGFPLSKEIAFNSTRIKNHFFDVIQSCFTVVSDVDNYKWQCWSIFNNFFRKVFGPTYCNENDATFASSNHLKKMPIDSTVSERVQDQLSRNSLARERISVRRFGKKIIDSSSYVTGCITSFGRGRVLSGGSHFSMENKLEML